MKRTNAQPTQTPENEVLCFQHVTFGYGGEPAVSDVTLSVTAGEFLALVGPNGGGKTTLLKLALGLLKPQKGSVALWGVPIERFKDWNRMAYVPQRAASLDSQFPGTVQEVAAYGEYRGVNPFGLLRSGPSTAVRDALETVGMWEYRKRRVVDLSTGQQQRVLIARALVKKPELILLDEPTAGVDTPAQEQFYGLLKTLNQGRGLTIVLVSHDIGAVLEAVTRVACINQRLVYHGAAADFPISSLSAFYGVAVNPVEHRHA